MRANEWKDHNQRVDETIDDSFFTLPVPGNYADKYNQFVVIALAS